MHGRSDVTVFVSDKASTKANAGETEFQLSLLSHRKTILLQLVPAIFWEKHLLMAFGRLIERKKVNNERKEYFYGFMFV